MGRKSGRPAGGNHKEFGGLINQGATCYLNTLLQTLYMTPEVKKVINRFIETMDEKINKDGSICYQLKVLFAELDAKKTANTYGITRNLDMRQQDVFKQQDIEEYFRRLLNKVATETDGSSNILQIYHSKVINSLTCLECNIEAPEECILLDIPLPIRPFNHLIRFQSVNESLEEFLKVETLSGDNLCYCENCEKKTVTEARYYFESLPQVLALQLKRFEFDCFKMCFTKLQDCIEIPLTLKFQKKNRDIDKTEWCLISMEPKEAAKTHLKKQQSFSLGPQPSKRSRNDEYEESQKLLKDESQQEVQEQEGPLQSNNHINNDCDDSPEPRKDESQQSYTTYELFAICDHSGGYGSGHYVAHIKPVSSSKWYCFNDTYVTEMEDFISGACYGSTVSTSGIPCKRSSTAYMLMYRKEELSSNQDVIGDNADEEKGGNEPMTLRDENGSHELRGIGDGEDNHYLEQSKQPVSQNLEDPPEKNATEENEGIETTGRIENRKCGTKEKEWQTQETDVVKEDREVMKEKSHEIDDMVTTEKAQGGQNQIGSKENVIREKGNMGDLKDSEGKTAEKVTGTEKGNKNATQLNSVTEKNTSNLDESVIGNNEKLKEELMEDNANEKNIKEGKETEEKNLPVKTKEMENNRTIQEREHTTGQKEMELEQEELKRMEQTSQNEGSSFIRVGKLEIEQLQGCKEEMSMEQNECKLERKEKQIAGEKESQEKEIKTLLETTKEEKEKGRREKKSEKKVKKTKRKNKSEDLQENKIEECPETENGMAENRKNMKGFKKLRVSLQKPFKKKQKSGEKKSHLSCIICFMK
ncbi:ubiquitin carboxyl-terminal hydrolase puf-like [Heptranchias perlo]|uniref:ubiquitin carboxyl-terminal hydrolase puf-like n=1 Tax=Heptranchias perlo TaxID=212740 RepID=UPI00355943E1